GFIANLRQNAPNWKPASGPAVVLGAGGAARAVVAALIEVGVPEIRLANRTRARADAIRQDFGAKIHVHEWVQAPNLLDDAVTVINTTALGMTGKQDFNVPMHRLNPGAVCNDLVYTPLKTQFLIEAEERGGIIVDGLGMLLHQAAPGFERWFGTRPEVDEATRKAVLSA
ncbi:MAG: shikimate dehydrogenase family protein, partial [Tabrizicola sp.]